MLIRSSSFNGGIDRSTASVSGTSIYVHGDRRLPPTDQDRGGAAGQVAGPRPVGRFPKFPHEAPDSGGVG
jgi:hypothetical protein